MNCRYCQQIAEHEPDYCAGPATFDVQGESPRCARHWRYSCELCEGEFHYHGLSLCPGEQALYCDACALGRQTIESPFWGFADHALRRCPFCAEWHPSLDRYEFEGGHWEDLPPVESLQPALQPALYQPASHQESAAAAEMWSQNAAPWKAACGPRGDLVRQITDPQLLELLGPVQGRVVLDAGCGEGYLCRQLAQRGASVIGVEYASALCAAALAHELQSPLGIRYVEASLSQPFDVPAQSVDRIVANNVFMYLQDMPGALAQFARVLRPTGQLVAVFAHPCFWGPGTRWHTVPVDSPRLEDSRTRRVSDYFERRPHRFTYPGYPAPLVFFPRTLGDYLSLFREAGFQLTHLEEPQPGPHLSASVRAQYGSIPTSVVVRLEFIPRADR